MSDSDLDEWRLSPRWTRAPLTGDDRDDSDDSDNDDDEPETASVQSENNEDNDSNDDDLHNDAATATAATGHVIDDSADASIDESLPDPPSLGGWLWKRSAKSNEWQRRYFSLSYATLKYAKDQKALSSQSTDIDLSDCVVTMKGTGGTGTSGSGSGGSTSLGIGTVTNLFASATKFLDSDRDAAMKAGRGFVFALTSPSSARTYELQVEDQQSLVDWTQAIRTSVKYLSLASRQQAQQHSRNPSISLATNSQKQQQIIRMINSDRLAPKGGAVVVKELTVEDFTVTSQSRASTWRRGPSMAALQSWTQSAATQQKQYPTFSLPEDDRLSSASTFCVHDTAAMAIVGCGLCTDLTDGSLQALDFDTKKRKFRASKKFGQLRNNKGRNEEKSPSPSHSHSSKSQCHGEVCSIDWLGDQLLLSSSGGVIALFDASPSDGLSTISQQAPSSLYYHPRCDALPAPSPGRWDWSSRVHAVALNPDDRETFLSVANQSFALWSIEQAQSPLFADTTFTSHVRSCCWSLQSFSSSAFLLGFQDGSIRMIDGRTIRNTQTRGLVWHRRDNHAHTSAVTSLAFSPLQPNFFASGSTDGTIRIFDVRNDSEPVRLLEGHLLSINAIKWSRSHPELLVSGSEDRTARLWNLRASPHFQINTQTEFGGSVVSVNWNPDSPMHFIACASSGEVRMVEIGREASVDIVPHRVRATQANAEQLTAKSPRQQWMEVEEKRIEAALYHRDFNMAFQLIAALSYRYWQLGRLDWASQLLKLTSTTLFANIAADTNKQITSKNFTAFITELARLIPSQSKQLAEVDSGVLARIQFIKTRLAIAKACEEGKEKDLLTLENSIVRLFDPSAIPPAPSINVSAPPSANIISGFIPDSIDGQTLERIVATIAGASPIKAIDFLVKATSIVKDLNLVHVLNQSAKLLLGTAALESNSVNDLTELHDGGDAGGHSEDEISVSGSSRSQQQHESNTYSHSVHPPPTPSVKGVASAKGKTPVTVAQASSISHSSHSTLSALIDKVLRDPKLLLAQLALLRQMIELVKSDEAAQSYNPYHDSSQQSYGAESFYTTPLSQPRARKLLALFDTSALPVTDLVSSHLLRLYCLSLHTDKQFDHTVVAVSSIVGKAPDSLLAHTMTESLTLVTLPAFTKFIDKSLTSREVNSDRLIAAALALINSLLASSSVFVIESNPVESLASKSLPSLIQALVKQWRDSSSRGTVKSTAESVLESVASMRKKRKVDDVADSSSELVHQFTTAVQQFAR